MTSDSANPSTTLRRLRRRLRAIASRVRLLLLTRALLVTLGLTGAVLLVLGVGDYLLRLPAGVRLVALLGVGYFFVRLVMIHVASAWRTRLRETDVALLVERHEPTLRGLLAAAVDLERAQEQPEGVDPDADEGDSRALREAALRTASRRLERVTLPGVLRPRVIGAPLAAAAALVLVLAGLGVLNPVMLRVGAARVLTPWTDARWPVRYAIDDTTAREPRAVDVPVRLRALIGRPDAPLDDTTRAMVSWRVLDKRGEAIGDWSRTLLMPQGRRDPDRAVSVYEQLLDVRDRAARRPESQRFTLEYRISTRDDRTPTRRLTLVRPPRLVGTTITLELPDYAAPIAESGVVASGQIHPEHGEARVSPVLSGTLVRVRWAFSKAVEEDEAPAWLDQARALGELVSYEHDTDSSVTLEVIARNPAVIEPAVLDRSGVPVREPIALALEVIDDLSPGVRLIEPSRDEALGVNARIDVRAELSDDLGLTRARLLAQVSTPPADSAGAPPEPRGEPVVLLERSIDNETRASVSAQLRFDELDPGQMGLAPGDEVRVWAQGWDLRADAGDATRGRASSEVRVLRIVADEELVERVRRSLDPLRANLRAIDERQGQVQDLLRDGSPRAGNEQRSVSERLRANLRAVEQLERTLERNRIDDEQLGQVVRGASSVLEEAASQSERAEDLIRRGDIEQGQRRQNQVRNQLGELLALLDQGQDAWLALRNMQRLKSELERLHQETLQLAQRTAGQSLDELSDEDRSALERILDRQMQNAEDARKAVNTLDKQADRLQEQDPTQGEALRRAAEQARAAQLEQKLREAGARIERNQTGSAARTQEEVLEELEQLLEELESTVRNRDNALRRELASIIDSLKGLIEAQEVEIARLDAQRDAGDLSGMDQRLIALVRNTLSVRDEALGAFPETRTIADHITRAGNAQDTAIVALRAAPADPDGAQRAQQNALQHLRNALEEAERLDDQAAQRQLQRAREELRQRYAEALDTQTRIHDETLALGDERLSRRERALARALSDEQEALRSVLEGFAQEHEGLADAPMFTLAHAQLDRLMRRSSAGLEERRIEPVTGASQRQAMAILASLIDVLGDPQQEEQDFEDGSESGGQSGGGQQGGADEPLIPPVAELRLLRSMQQLVFDETRALSEQDGADPERVRAVGALQRELYEQGAALIERISPSSVPESSLPGEEPGNPGPIRPVEQEGAERAGEEQEGRTRP